MTDDDLRTRIAAALSAHIERQLTNCDTGREECGCGQQGSSTYGEHVADAVIRALGPIPDRRHVDDHGRTWEWCGGQPGTWAWRITANGTADE